MTLSNGTRLGDHPEIRTGFAKIAAMMDFQYLKLIWLSNYILVVIHMIILNMMAKLIANWKHLRRGTIGTSFIS